MAAIAVRARCMYLHFPSIPLAQRLGDFPLAGDMRLQQMKDRWVQATKAAFWHQRCTIGTTVHVVRHGTRAWYQGMVPGPGDKAGQCAVVCLCHCYACCTATWPATNASEDV